MPSPPPKLLLTGEPGCGKTTVIARVVTRLYDELPMTGFFTEEWLHDGRRRGFRGRTLKGKAFVLAERGRDSEFRVGRYGVVLGGLESKGLPALDPDADTRLVVLDEIGKMEAFSSSFREKVEKLLAGPHGLLATVAAHGVGWIKKIRHDPRATLLTLERGGGDAMVDELERRIRSAGLVDHRKT